MDVIKNPEINYFRCYKPVPDAREWMAMYITLIWVIFYVGSQFKFSLGKFLYNTGDNWQAASWFSWWLIPVYWSLELEGDAKWIKSKWII